jgi:hypothetical protein
MSLRSKALHALALAVVGLQMTAAAAEPPHNVILFVPDGLRALKVTPETTPAMAAIRDKGVNFKNPHSLFPTFTTANASAMATGHYLGDTGDFSNTIYTGYPVGPADGSVTPFLENDSVLRQARHDGRQCRAAGLFRRRRQQDRAADVQSAQQAVRAGVLVARSRRHAAQSG